MNISSICNKIIEYSFYSLFFFVPLVFASETSELFEFNKMWLTFLLTIVIAATWAVKSIAQKQFRLQRTPLDLPILLFLFSQVISTFLSLDMHVSLWGYYSRFNGGLLSILSYIFLYYAFASNLQREKEAPVTTETVIKRVSFFMLGISVFLCGFLVFYILGASIENIKGYIVPFGIFVSFFFFVLSLPKDMLYKSLYLSLLTGGIVAAWGILTHFGHDPTCLLFRDSLDVSCWTNAFQPKIRIFSTLGQPNWLAAYLSILLPISIAMFLKNFTLHKMLEEKNNESRMMHDVFSSLYSLFSILYSVLLYVALLYTGSRSGFLGLLAGGFVFFLVTFFTLSKEKIKLLALIGISLLVLSFFIGTPLDQQIKTLTAKFLPKQSLSQTTDKRLQTPAPAGPALETGGTESGKIRLIVWSGALDAWRHNPFFGTGVETFAFAYYQYKPIAHNLTSEWDYLYNKAHNEYINYLTTTGAFGLGTYLLMIVWFLIQVVISTSLRLSEPNGLKPKTEGSHDIITLALIASYISILVSNFLGFSVVIINLYLFILPAFVFALAGMLDQKKVFVFSGYELKTTNHELRIAIAQGVLVTIILLASGFMIFTLHRFWEADKAYALGYNFDQASQYQYGYFKLGEAIELWPNEPTYQDEFSYASAVLAVTLASQKDQTASDSAKIASYAAKLTNDALQVSDHVVSTHPNNIVFWKTRVRMLYVLSQIDPQYLSLALESIQKAKTLAPTDAKVSHSLGVLYGQNNQTEKAIKELEQTIVLKPDYIDAYQALGVFYHDAAVDKNGKIKDAALEKKAVDTMHFILNNLSKDNPKAKQTLKAWGAE